MKKITFSAITILIVCLMFTLQVNINAALFGNEGEKAYCGSGSNNPCPPDPPKANSTSDSNDVYSGPTIRDLIVVGGGFALQSSSYINGFLNMIEISEISSTGPDYKKLHETLNSAIYYMEMARDTYFQLKNLAFVTPYNQEVIYSLNNFDYDLFREEKGLFPIIFEKVKGLLAEGNVTGVFNEFYLYTGQILDLMYTIKKDIDAGMFPNLSTVWSVNQKYSEFKLFGQYTAQVFYGIK